jgi:hypothetical protein
MKNRISVAIAPLRREPSDRSEMVSQGLFGEELEVLERQEKWSMIRLKHDGYEGWIDNKQLDSVSINEELERVNVPLLQCLRSNHDSMWLPAGAMAPAAWNTSSAPVSWTGSRPDIEKCALLFLHAPYLWGGRTVMGIDCSGFSQMVMLLNGISLPRDAYQQAEIGTTVTFIEESLTGDLAFFDNAEGRITHVGIVLRDSNEGCRIIHASGQVRIDTLDHEGIFHSEQSVYTHKLRIIKRILL